MHEAEKKQALIFIQSAQHEAWKRFKPIHPDLKYALGQMNKAIGCLHKTDYKKALNHLEVALELLEVVVSQHPVGEMMIRHDVDSYEYLEKPETVERELSYIKHLLDMGQVQKSRKLLENLRSELVISRQFCEPTQLISALLSLTQEVMAEKSFAVDQLEALLENFKTEKTILPLPLVISEAAIKNASKLPHQTPSEKERVFSQLNMAREQLEVAQILGYTHREPQKYQALYEQVRFLDQDVKESSELELIYEVVLNKMTEFTNSVILG